MATKTRTRISTTLTDAIQFLPQAFAAQRLGEAAAQPMMLR